jgi:hypothetical protein
MERLATDLMILTPPTLSSTSSQRLGCFLETLARWRPDPKLTGELADMEGEKDHPPLNELVLGMALLGFVQHSWEAVVVFGWHSLPFQSLGVYRG